MDRILIKGGRKLKGEVSISGSKNAALPAMAACLLADSPCVLKNVPDLQDIKTMVAMLEFAGAEVKRVKGNIHIDPKNFKGHTAPYDIVRKMRASIYVLGPMLAKFGGGEVSLPGGCAIGPRPVDLHLKGFEALGATISIQNGYVIAHVDKLKGSEMSLEGANGPSIGATCNTMMAASLAEGKTIIRGAAREPEVEALALMLKKMGAKISGMGTSNIEIEGVKKLNGVEYKIIPDRIETGTFMVAAAITKGDVLIKNCEPAHMTAVIDKLAEIGVPIEVSKKTIHVKPAKSFHPVSIRTLPYPGFPTDMQAQFSALLCLANGISTVHETIYEERFMHTSELSRMGANLHVKDSTATIEGVDKLSGAPVMASDLRASAALVIAGLVASGQTEILRVYHIDRGYEKIEEKLKALGTDITRFAPTGNA